MGWSPPCRKPRLSFIGVVTGLAGCGETQGVWCSDRSRAQSEVTTAQLGPCSGTLYRPAVLQSENAGGVRYCLDHLDGDTLGKHAASGCFHVHAPRGAGELTAGCYFTVDGPAPPGSSSGERELLAVRCAHTPPKRASSSPTLLLKRYSQPAGTGPDYSPHVSRL
ncbi:unnamed protein product [Gadus morhua 'NCC']